MKNANKLHEIHKSQVRQSIFNHGVWKGVVNYSGKLVYATLTNYASLNDPNLLEFYNLMS